MCVCVRVQKFRHADFLRTSQLIPNSAESWNWMKKDEIKLVDMEVGKAQKSKIVVGLRETGGILTDTEFGECHEQKHLPKHK